MKGIVGRQKRFVGVRARTTTEGDLIPLSLMWEGGLRYQIDEVLDCRPARSLKTRCAGLRYTVRVGDTTTYLWREGLRWFVEAKVTILPEE